MLENEICIKDILDDGLWHPVMPPFKIHKGEATSFWVSEKSQGIFQPENQDEAQCYRVDFKSEVWNREGGDLSAIGRSALIGAEVILDLLSIEGSAYIRNHDIAELNYKIPVSLDEGEKIPF